MRKREEEHAAAGCHSCHSSGLVCGDAWRCAGAETQAVWRAAAAAAGRGALAEQVRRAIVCVTRQTGACVCLLAGWRGCTQSRLAAPYSIPVLHHPQATVAIRAIGLNFADVFSVLGLYRAFTEVGHLVALLRREALHLASLLSAHPILLGGTLPCPVLHHLTPAASFNLLLPAPHTYRVALASLG